jgi:hypothetical protein
MLSLLGVAGTSMAATAAATKTATRATAVRLADDSSSSCHLGHGVKHVVEILFDNVHYFRDNPNVPSDLEMMPNLLNFFEDNGTFLANNHTPLIAHTADDSLTSYTGLYGDRAGVPISNDYEVYNSDGPHGTYGTTDNAEAFTYWTDKIDDTSSPPSPDRDTNPNMVYSPVPPATAKTPVTPDTQTPAPWVPFTRSGCDVGEVATANMELENTSDIPEVFGASSPEAKQLAADSDPYKDPETADYIGVAVHCARGNAFCATAKGIKYGQTSPSPTAAADLLPDEPGGYTGYTALYGHRYLAPQLGAGTPNVTRNGYEVTNAAGNLVDENGNQINGEYLTDHPGFPGYDIDASQATAYMADILEAGVPVVYSYVADIHGNEDIPALSSVCAKAGSALGSGTPCYLAQAKYYNAAFGTFFKRLAADGITPANTEFILSSDEGDHEAGANVGRAVQPTPANCDGVTVTCTYPTGTFGELDGNVTGLLATEKHDTTAFGMEYDTAPEYYINGDPGPDTPLTRTFERDVAGLTAYNPYAGKTQQIANYLADPTEEAILHMVNADPARTPTLAEFAKPDYYLGQGKSTCDDAVTGTTASDTADCVTVDDAYAWDHGDFAAEINTNYIGFAGPGVKDLGLQGLPPNEGPNSAGPGSGQTIAINSGTTGPWTDETDIRPTLMYLTGLTDDYEHDGRVITQILADPNWALSRPGVTKLGACYKQLNSSVGEFGSYTLAADTAAVQSKTPGDAEYLATDKALAGLERVRDALALRIKGELEAAAFEDTPIRGAQLQTFACQAIIGTAHALASHV